MLLTEKLDKAGEHPFSFTGGAGILEGILTVPVQMNGSYVAFLGHPHSLQGGTMNNKVVTTMARTFKELGIPSLRFNFRGVGQSAGVYDDGIGESKDMLLLVKLWEQERKNSRILFAGFSFGSYVAYRAASQHPHELLLTIAPPVHHYNYREFQPAPHPWVIVQGDTDEVVPASLVEEFATGSIPPLPVIHFGETGHFFHGKLLELKTKLTEAIHTQGLL
ncbi:alpha/beta hydrolase [Legionella hackeliae]|uniref:Alpha/beta fold family hydrolase n=1 Tax=Legionella hackeliae TaxID=449 RepID=A0A0A8UT80_LEGHA|nr:membrane protein [Legionella hackeliae]KTD12534.1 alpha/beta superfamily transporter hydrolase [Legionella hackeliae]CEK11948.1 Alpha/beta fold family hydrolase [Legionella hackeliae]STX48722.1 transmembrane protein [Legionella hackeliae]